MGSERPTCSSESPEIVRVKRNLAHFLEPGSHGKSGISVRMCVVVRNEARELRSQEQIMEGPKRLVKEFGLCPMAAQVVNSGSLEVRLQNQMAFVGMSPRSQWGG